MSLTPVGTALATAPRAYPLQVEVEVKTLGRWHPLAAMVRASGRSWWQCRYRDGKQLSEWETAPGILTRIAVPDPRRWRSSRWEEVRKRAMVGLRLLCPTPDGVYASLRVNRDEGRFIQLKHGEEMISVGMGGGTSARRADAHLIGVVNDDGQVRCVSWENRTHAFIQRLDTPFCITCGLAREECGGRDVTLTTREELREWIPDPAWPERVNRSRETVYDFVGERRPLVQWTDSIHGMRYRQIGPLSLDVQGVRL